MSHILMTWNPGRANNATWDPIQFDDVLVVPFLAGKITRTQWSVGQNRNNIGPGDNAYLYRQGECGRGIVAHGVIRSLPKVGKHWAKMGKTANYVKIDWDAAVPVDLAFDVDDLEKAVPGFAWRQVYGSGRRVPDVDGQKLEKAWRRYIQLSKTRKEAERSVSLTRRGDRAGRG
jgi:hypothetical protein